MASLQQRKGWFHLLFRYQGKQYSHALRTKDRREAEAIRGSVDRVLLRLHNHELDPPPQEVDLTAFLLAGGMAPTEPPPIRTPLTLQDMIDQYSQAHANGAMEANSLATARLHLSHFADHFGKRFNPRSLTSRQLQNYLDSRRRKDGVKKSLSPFTLRKEIASLRAAWNWAVRTNILSGSFPGQGLTYPKLDEKPPFQTRQEIERKIARQGLTKDQIKALWENLFLTKPELEEFLDFARQNAYQPFLSPMIAFAGYTGARRSELLRVLIDDVDLDAGTAVIREKKRVRGSRSTRRVPISGALNAHLKDWLQHHPGGQFLFCHQPEVFRSKKRRPEKPMPFSALTKDEAHDHFQRLIKGSKWEVLRGWHVLRHSFISICAAEGVDSRLLQAWVGHLNEETHRRYLHLVPSKEQQAISEVFGSPATVLRFESEPTHHD